MSELESKLVEHLRSLSEAAREFYECGCVTESAEEETFDMELVRTEDFLEGVIGDADI